MKAEAIAVIGIKKSGKTTTIENLIRELTKRGYNVAVIKHISEPDFTIDKPGKDTWKFAQAGAKTIITAATNETTTIEKIQLEKIPLGALLKKCAENQIILIEGLKKQIANNKNIPKINNLFKKARNYKKIFQSKEVYGFDERNQIIRAKRKTLKSRRFFFCK